VYQILQDEYLTDEERLQLEAWASGSTLSDERVQGVVEVVVRGWRSVVDALPDGVHRKSAWVGFLGGLMSVEKLIEECGISPERR